MSIIIIKLAFERTVSAVVKSSRALLKNRFSFAALFWTLCAVLISLYCFLPFAQNTLIATESTAAFIFKTALIAVTCIALLSAIFELCCSCERSFFIKAGGGLTTAEGLFYYFKPAEFFSALRFECEFFLIKLTAVFLCAVPVCAVTYMLLSALKSGAKLWVICSLAALAIACAVCSAVTCGKLSRLVFLARYLFFITKKGSALSLCLMSAKKMENHTGKLLKLKLSLFPYKLLCVLVLPSFYVIFLHRQSYALLAKEIICADVEKKEEL